MEVWWRAIGQLGATTVQGHRQMQGITGPQAEGWILEQFSSVRKAVAVQRTQFNAALQQSLELLPAAWRACGLRPWWRCLMPRTLWVSVISQSLLISVPWHCSNQSSAQRRGTPRSPMG